MYIIYIYAHGHILISNLSYIRAYSRIIAHTRRYSHIPSATHACPVLLANNRRYSRIPGATRALPALPVQRIPPHTGRYSRIPGATRACPALLAHTGRYPGILSAVALARHSGNFFGVIVAAVRVSLFFSCYLFSAQSVRVLWLWLWFAWDGQLSLAIMQSL